jgi:DNA polymerase III delta prime subunit
MHSFLIIGGDAKIKRLKIDNVAKQERATKQIPFLLQKIEDARELKKIVKFSFGEKCAIVIENIDTATHEALNAFLKNLEEPNENLIYILTATNLNNIIPTIVSRCEVIQVKQKLQVIQINKEVKLFLEQNINKKFETIGKIKEREIAIKFVEDLIITDNDFKNSENYLKTLRNLKLNGNVSLQLTNLLVKIDSRG